jgi:hypothetical protein
VRHLLTTLIAVTVVTACGGGTQPYTWGDASEEVARVYCEGVEACGFAVDVELCVEHAAWHLCVPDGTCDDEVDADAAAEAIGECAAAVEQGAEDFAAGTDQRICTVVFFGGLPSPECDAVWPLDPGAAP